jgi:hypothetical protein
LSVLFLMSGTAGDPDLWGHVRFGQDMLAQATLRPPDTYSFTADRAWINHEWLSEILLALAFAAAGPAGLNVLRILVVACVLGLVWHAASSLGERRQLMMVAAAGLGIYMRALPIRPQMFSLLMFSILLLLLKRADDRRSLRVLAWVPLVMAVWVNLHGGWIVGFGYVLLWCLRAGFDAPWRNRLILIVAALAALASTLVNPYGLGMWEFLATTVRMERPMIADWQPLYEAPYTVWISWLAGAAVLGTGAIRSRSRADWIDAGLAALFGVAAMRVSRLDAFFALAAVFHVARILERQLAASAAASSDRRQPSSGWAAAFGVCVLVASVGLVPRVLTVPVADRLLPDAGVAAYVRDERLKGKVLTWFDWGQYLIWHFGDDLKVSMDGRRETVYGPALISDHLKFYFGTLDEWRYADSLNADYVLIPRHLPVARTLQLHGWNVLCEGQASILLTRASDVRRCPATLPRQTQRSFPEL